MRGSRAAVAAVACGVLASIGSCDVVRAGDPQTAPAVQSQAQSTATFIDYAAKNPDQLTATHQPGHITYPMSPPVGGPHNPLWMNCSGDIYADQVPNEHAVHSLEHGAIWVTYQPGLAAEQLEALASRVRDRAYMFLSPYPGLTRPIAIQAWGKQLLADRADDPEIDSFIQKYRQAGPEPGAPCSGGYTDTGTQPWDPA